MSQQNQREAFSSWTQYLPQGSQTSLAKVQLGLDTPVPEVSVSCQCQAVWKPLILPSLLMRVGGAKLRSKMPSGWIYQGS